MNVSKDIRIMTKEYIDRPMRNKVLH